MTRGLVEAGCPSCGRIVVAASSLVCAVGDGEEAALCELACPRCGRALHRALEPAVVTTLLFFGARRAERALPFELLERHAGPALSWDDLLDFHLALDATCCPHEHVAPGPAAS